MEPNPPRDVVADDDGTEELMGREDELMPPPELRATLATEALLRPADQLPPPLLVPL
jgi:hypothetical protein